MPRRRHVPRQRPQYRSCEMETGRKRNRRLRFWVDDAELAAIRQKMAEAGTVNMAAYLRKMAMIR